jgi:hypothetical protein
MVSSHYIMVLRNSAFHEPPGSGADTCLRYGQAAGGAGTSGPDAEAARPDFRGQPDHDRHGRKGRTVAKPDYLPAGGGCPRSEPRRRAERGSQKEAAKVAATALCQPLKKEAFRAIIANDPRL